MEIAQAEHTDGNTEVLVLDVEDELAELARVRARAAFADIPEPGLADTIMVLDELASNALRHGRPPHQVRLLRRPGWLRIEVDDTNPDPAHKRAPTGTGGRGLALVEAFAVTWGQDHDKDRKTVWAELTPADTATGQGGHR